MKQIKISFIIFILATITAIGQKTITGNVKDSKGIPIPGANVQIKGQSNGTVTNAFGDYLIANVKPSNVIVFSFLGYNTQEIKVLEQEKIDVKLTTNINQLDEAVVIVGYGAVKKKDLTGSVSSVKTEDLMKTATTNFDQALAGRAAGVRVTSSDGTPGSTMNIVIRGGNSITGSNAPLYVVDGIPFEDFDPSSISTRDIKSFDILKDASATAIYGSRGANGVIVITTFAGRSDGKFDVNFNTSLGVQYIPTRLEVMNPYQFVKYQETIAYANDAYIPQLNVANFKSTWIDPELYRNIKGNDWQDLIFRTAYVSNHNISIRGGNKKTNIYFSGSFIDQDGTLINTGFKKYNNRLKFTSELNDKLSFNGQVTYSKSKTNGLTISGNNYNSVIRNAVSFRPVNPINFNSNDEAILQDLDPYLFDPVLTLKNIDQHNNFDEFQTSLGLNYDITKKLIFDIKANYWTRDNERTIFFNRNTQEAERSNFGINGLINNSKTNTITSSSTLTYKNRKKKHNYNFLLGFETQSRDIFTSSLRNTNLPTDIFGIYNLGLATGATIAQTGYTENTLMSYLGRINYTYSNRYYATLNFRTDGSSKFRKENRWGYFPSFSLAWKTSNEKFMNPIVDVVSDLKFRAGWGLTGNNRIGDFDAYNQFAVNNTSGYVLGVNQSFVPGAIQSSMAVPDLRWETTAQTNLGIDLELFKKINVTADFYHKRTKDLLLNAEMAPSTGFDKVQQNVGEVTNTGIELTIDTKNIKNKNFEWDTSFNIAFNRTNTVKLNSGQKEILVDPAWDSGFMQTEYQYVTRVGNPVGMIYGLEFDGIYQLEDFIVDNKGNFTLLPGIPSYRPQMQPGMVKFKDQLTVDTNNDGKPDAGDGVINTADRKIIGNPLPKHIGGITNNFRYKNFDIQILLQWSYDFDILNGNKSEYGSIFNTGRNGLTSLTNIWTPNNPNNEIGGMRYNTINTTTPFGYKLDTRHVDDGSYIKLKTIAMGYNIPKEVLEKYKIKKMRLTLAAQNLYRWTKYTGYDPDVSVGRFGALTPGLDYSAYPQSVTINGGVEITF